MAKAKRLFQVARELGVESKAVLEKCKAEGLDVQNHMSSVSVGLEATIREWFSEHEKGEPGTTAVETAEKVDLTKVKKAKRRRKAAKPAEPEAETATEEAEKPAKAAKKAAPKVEPAEAEVEAEPAAEPAKAKAKPKPKVEQPTEPEQPAKPAAKKSKAKDEDTGKHEGEVREQAPEEPEDVKPAGPRLETPKAAKLRGPKVIRVEEPEQVRAPRPRRQQSGPMRPAAEVDIAGKQSDVLRSRGPMRGKGAGKGLYEEDSARSPRRSKRRKGGRTGDAELWHKGVRREQDLVEREERLSHAAGYLKQRRRQMKKHAEGGSAAQTPLEVGGRVAIDAPFTIKDLSAATGIKAAEIVAFLFNKGIMATINQAIDPDLALEVCLERGIELEIKEAKSAGEAVEAELEKRDRQDERRRPPVVAVLGHVDHGKTSLLDRIRAEDVAAGEAGGITQHIGAFRATITGTDEKDKTVVFLDTPGHQAFTNMRARGASLADLVVLVVAADDGVMPQTIESINHAKAAGIPIVVALNKIDKAEATDPNIQKILGQLAEHELNPTEWGGETEVMKVSAETGEGVAELIEILDYQAELQELTADYAGFAYGQVVEAELDQGRGSVARVLVQEGRMKVGDFVVIGRAFGKVRSMVDDHGRELEVAGPATPVELSGIDDVPDAGDKFYVVDSLKRAEQIAEDRRDVERKKELAAKSKVTLDNVFEQMKAGDVKELRVVLKADVQGSVEVLRKAIEEVGSDNEEVAVRVLHAAVGGITESDVLLAEASDAVIIGFEVIASQQARSEAERRNVDIRLYRVIYDIVDDIKAALEGMLSPEQREEVLGHAEVREVFKVSKVGAVAGCYVTDGVVRRNANIRVTRDDIVIEHDRTLEQLKRFKDDAREVTNGMECGMKIEGYDDIREGDILECYVTTEVKASLPG